MFVRLLKVCFLIVLGIYTPIAVSGIVVGGTRVIYASDKPDTTISIYNKETQLPYLIQSWVDPFSKEDKTKSPFTVIPPVSRIEAGQEKILRIVKTTGELPKDRESVFWLNIKNIPPSGASDGAGTLEIAIKTRIKLFWRPSSIKIVPEQAYKQIKWQLQGNTLVMENPTPIHVNIMDVFIGGKDIPLNMIKPFETLTLPIPKGAAGHELVWRYINDYGAISEPIKQAL